ncbi:hypothetical protein [Salipiger mangrovisoli]|uniref:Uncharacterized protein n=1 Tax=Salipiger mangrovisoli TaxID=2865933 RepID=A0ABR9X1G1_9RHOB|nr:hypothetical protein [Salipiger mangrovisoli]MBE9637379.1 hypothetical protein [Salipiger mangrovisoli]
MSGWHLSLLALAALGTLGCMAGAGPAQRGAARASLAAMALAMAGGTSGLVLGAGALLALVPLAARGAAPALCAHRAASNLVMALVLGALFVLNGSAICANGAIPLLSAQGLSRLPMAGPDLYLRSAALALGLYAAFGLLLSLRALRHGQLARLGEIIPMTLATAGMGVGLN